MTTLAQAHDELATLAAECIRALRGRRSQAAFSRLLGYSSSVVHRWEAGKTWPTAAVFLRACARCGRDPHAALTRFFRRTPRWLAEHPPDSPQAVAALLQQLRGKTPIVQVAELSGFNRYTVSRWLSGDSQPRLFEFFSLVEAMSRRLLDFVATLIDPAALPSARARWQRLERVREAAYREPWSHAVLRALELDGYREASDGASWLAGTLGISEAQVERALSVLETTEQIALESGRWVPRDVLAVTTGVQPSKVGLVTTAWSKVALARQQVSWPGHFGYSLFSVSRADLRRIRDLNVEYLRAMQAIIAESEPNECVGLLCVQLLDLSGREDNALA